MEQGIGMGVVGTKAKGWVARRLPDNLKARLKGGPAPVVGVVERFNRAQLVGWIVLPPNAPPTPVGLYVGDLLIAETYPTLDAPLSGLQLTKDDGTTPEPVRGRGVTAGPKDDRRRAGQPVAVFSFQVLGLWDFLRPGNRISVRVNGSPLPIVGHGMWLNPRRGGARTVEELRDLLGSGHKLTKSGGLTAPREQNVMWQKKVTELYDRTRTLLADKYGYDTFLMYGSLLGQVRDGGPISHDTDFDSAYVSKHTTGEEVAEELVQIALDLLAAGLVVDLRHRLLHIHDPETNQRIDLFHSWFDDADRLRITWGVAGTQPFTAADWQGTTEVDFAGGRCLVPRNAEKLLAHVYGDDWRQPKPGFSWRLSRTDAAEDGALSTAARTKVYWANFYARTSYTSGSTFFEFVNAHPEMPSTVIDIGCGDGRDSCAFAGAGRQVLGLDQSPVGVQHATDKASGLDLSGTVRFEVCDVSDEAELGAVLDRGVEGRDGPIVFYLRFFLHAINEEVQARLLAAIRTHTRPGDLFAAEFRTDKDSDAEKVHGNHYRRFQNAIEFRKSLTSDFGFDEVLFDLESDGLSPYRDEDPVLYRIIARRTS